MASEFYIRFILLYWWRGWSVLNFYHKEDDDNMIEKEVFISNVFGQNLHCILDGDGLNTSNPFLMIKFCTR